MGTMTPKLPPAQAGAPVQHLACFCTSISSQGLAPLFGGCECLWGQTPRCPQRSPRALRKGTSFPVFVIILGSKFSSFVLFFPTVVALTASSPSEVWDPPTHPRRGGTKPSFNQSGAAGEGGGGCFPNPFGEGSFSPPPHHVCGITIRHTDEPPQPRARGDAPAPPARGMRTTAGTEPGSDKWRPNFCFSPRGGARTLHPHCPAPSGQSS